MKNKTMPTPRSELPELEDRLLAQCDGDWVSVPMALAVLASWLDREISRPELVAALERLVEMGYVVRRSFLSARTLGTATSPVPDLGVEFTATPAGVDFLRTTRG